MRVAVIAAVLSSLLELGCGAVDAAPNAAPSSSSTPPPSGHRGRASPPPTIRVSVLRRDGAAYGPSYELAPDPAEMVHACLDASGDTAFLEGFVLFEVRGTEPHSVQVQSAEGVPPSAVECIRAGLVTAVVQPGFIEEPVWLAYVSIGVD